MTARVSLPAHRRSRIRGRSNSRAPSGALAVSLLVAALAAPLPVQACGLEPSFNNGFTVSHPGSLDVAVAVARARGDGLLPKADVTSRTSNHILLSRMIRDLAQVQSRLNAGRATRGGGSRTSFSLVLVGPGLWSHFHMSAGGVLARYHADGPLEGSTVVLTHHSVIEALLRGSLATEDALARGLLSYSGNDADVVSSAFSVGFDRGA